MRIRSISFCVVTLLYLAVLSWLTPFRALHAQSVQPSPELSALLGAEDKRFSAQVDHNASVLQETIAEDASLAHASGYHQSKAEFIQAILSNRLAYHSIKPHDRIAIISGELGVVRGFVSMDLGERTAENSYLAVYIRRDSRWQLLDWQTGAAAPNQTPPMKQ